MGSHFLTVRGSMDKKGERRCHISSILSYVNRFHLFQPQTSQIMYYFSGSKFGHHNKNGGAVANT
jgi:hypothetical protein